MRKSVSNVTYSDVLQNIILLVGEADAYGVLVFSEDAKSVLIIHKRGYKTPEFPKGLPEREDQKNHWTTASRELDEETHRSFDLSNLKPLSQIASIHPPPYVLHETKKSTHYFVAKATLKVLDEDKRIRPEGACAKCRSKHGKDKNNNVYKHCETESFKYMDVNDVAKAFDEAINENEGFIKHLRCALKEGLDVIQPTF